MTVQTVVEPGTQTDSEAGWPPAPGYWTDEDWRRLVKTNLRYEVVKGVLYEIVTPAPRHQAVSRNLAHSLLSFVEAHTRGEVYYAPVNVFLPCPETMVQPDLLFISEERRDTVYPDVGVFGSPDLIIEILSPGDWLKDRKEKFALYLEAKVREYWIVDPRLVRIEVYVLRGPQYELLDWWETGDMAHSEVLPGFTVAVDEVFVADQANGSMGPVMVQEREE